MTTRNGSHASQHDRRDREAWRPSDPAGNAKRPDAKRPFDSTDLGRVPRPREDDPPYRPWWVVDNSDARQQRLRTAPSLPQRAARLGR